jgi:dolichol-phosphate mannosyltransferase
MSSTVVVIPTYEEAETIGTTLDAVLAAAPAVDVLVVDDDSPDGTGDLVRSHPAFGTRVQLLSRPGKDGLGAAYRAGFGWAISRGYDVVVQMDADLSHPPTAVPALVEALDDADVAIGSRYVPGGRVEDWGVGRRLLSWGGNTYVRLVLGLGVHDATAGFRAFRRESLLRIGALRSEANGFAFQVENTWKAALAGLETAEVPITFRDRTLGRSKMSSDIVREALTLVLLWRWQQLRTRLHLVPRRHADVTV